MKRYKVTLQEAERQKLEAITCKGAHQSQQLINALILLNCDEGPWHDRQKRGEDIAEILHVSICKIDRTKKRFVEDGLEAALGRRQSTRVYKRKADGDFEARLIALSCSEPPEGYAQWSLRSLAERAVELDYIGDVSYETVRRVLKKRNQTVAADRLGDSPNASGEFVAAMERVLDVYRRPYNPARPVVRMDETPRQLIGETRISWPVRPGQPARHDDEYERCGVANVVMATEPLAGQRITQVTERKGKVDWARFVEIIARHYPDADRITLVMDNLNTQPGRILRGLYPRTGQGTVGSLRIRLHAQAWQLAQRRRNRNQGDDPTMPGAAHR